MVLLGSCRKTLKILRIELSVGLVSLSWFPHKPRHRRCLLLTGRAWTPGPTPSGTQGRQTSHSWMGVDTHALGAGEGILFPFFSNGTKSPGFLIWVLTRIFRAQTQIKMWPEPGSGPWLVWEDDSELKKSLVPSVSGGPLRKHSPPGTASERPLHSFTKSFKEQMPVRTFYSQPQYSQEHSRRFSEGISFYGHHSYIISATPSPNSEQNHHFWITCGVKWHLNPNLYQPQRRKRLSFGGLQHIHSCTQMESMGQTLPTDQSYGCFR